MKILSYSRNKKTGFVLVSVLMLGTLLLSCATAFAWFVRTQVKGVLQERVALTNRSMAQVLTESLISGLARIEKRSKADSFQQRWFKPFLFPADQLGLWAVQIKPLDDKIPIRNLFLPDGNTLRQEMIAPWEDMWETLGYRSLAVPVEDFLDKNDKPRVGSRERKNFLNRPPIDMSEMLLMDEITPVILWGNGVQRGLANFCTLWSSGKINLNVAPPEVLEILPGLRGQSGLVARYREDHLLRSFDDLKEIPGLSARTATQLTNIAAFKSQYFSLHIEFLDESPGGTAFDIILDRTNRKVVRWEES